MAKNNKIFGKKISPGKLLNKALKENPLEYLPTPKKIKTIALKKPSKPISLKNIKIVTINNPFFPKDEE